jgi:hypothetical protein
MLLVGFSFFITRYINVQVLPFLAYDDLTQFIYLPAGVRLLAVAIFGWFGAVGILWGWILCYLLVGEKSLMECFFLGITSGVTAIASLHIWQIVFRVDDAFSQINAKNLLSLITLSALISAFVRYAYILGGDPTADFIAIFSIGLIGDISGSIIVIYSIRVGFLLRRYFSG